MSQIGRWLSLDVSNCLRHFSDLLGAFYFRNQNQVRLLGDDLFQIFETERQLIDADHALAIAEADAA